MKKFAKILAVCMLVMIVAMSFASCGLFGVDIDKAEDRLEDKGYEVDCYSWGDEKTLWAIKGDDCVSITEYEDSDDAEEAYDDIMDNWDEFSETGAEQGFTDITCNKQGNVVYYGTVKGVKDALGFPANLFVFEK